MAISMKESLVEVSPSTVMQLNDWSAAAFTKCSNTGCATLASVATKPSMVAILGRIMPEPLLMPVSVMVWPLMTTVREAAFGCVSVVMIASAALYQLSLRRLASACGRPALMRSTGSGSKITPVENGRICCGAQSSSCASAAQVALAAARPAAPVPALALPVLTTSARIGAWPAPRCALHTCTGAAQKRLAVNTPATVAPGASVITSRSLRLALRTPASA